MLVFLSLLESLGEDDFMKNQWFMIKREKDQGRDYIHINNSCILMGVALRESSLGTRIDLTADEILGLIGALTKMYCCKLHKVIEIEDGGCDE